MRTNEFFSELYVLLLPLLDSSKLLNRISQKELLPPATKAMFLHLYVILFTGRVSVPACTTGHMTTTGLYLGRSLSRGFLFWGFLCPDGLCLGGSLFEGSLSGDSLSRRIPLEQNHRQV